MTLPVAFRGRLRLPAIAAPMFLVSGPELVAETCKAGVAGKTREETMFGKAGAAGVASGQRRGQWPILPVRPARPARLPRPARQA